MAEAERITGTPESEPGSGADSEPGSEGGRPAEPEQKAARGKRRIVALLLVAAFVYLLDLGSKLIVVEKLEHHAPVQIIGTLLQFEVIRNRGAAFSIGEALTIFLTIIAATVIVVIARIARKLYSLPWAFALGLLLGGAFGNLTDRIFRSPGVFEGAVVDFIAPAHFAVFNLADSAIVCGGFLIVILSFRGLDPDGTIHKD
ncbi:signal peptidase II [Streptomyces piniterrae]|uniref:Lipoprotein signal peptidase n=1 Tax=Streptomyces piniterrae TaxID=2571125 RepID=A0A4U0NB96_9ACTN|nr:signal peptidase II [Streptomyces piniterrae]TJZ50983.1 signal peptidase II [Streptomyces piniterrae]